MRVDISNTITNFNTAQESWSTAGPSLPSLPNGVAVDDVSRSFQEISTLLSAIQVAEVDGLAWAIQKANIESLATQLNQAITPYVGNPAQVAANTPNICAWLWSLRSVALSLIPIHPQSERLSPDFVSEFSARLEEMQRQFVEAQGIRDNVKRSEESALLWLREIATHKSQAGSDIEEVQKLLATIQAHEREAGTAKTNASGSAATATTETAAVAKLCLEIGESVSKKDALFSEFETRRLEIAGLLENANKVGLARSFQDKRRKSTFTWAAWAVLFVLGIGGLMAIGLLQLIPLLNTTTPDPTAVAVRILVTSPLIWLTWFAARQYGHALRISEDYGFKEAAAMAFTGYRNEVASDAEMLKLLQESAIRNFGSNPAELLLKRPDAASPLHDALERALEKLEPKQVMEAVTNLVASLPKVGKS